MEDSPDVDAVVVRHGEDEEGKALEGPTPEVGDVELEGEPERADERVVAEIGNRRLEGIDEVKGYFGAPFVA